MRDSDKTVIEVPSWEELRADLAANAGPTVEERMAKEGLYPATWWAQKWGVCQGTARIRLKLLLAGGVFAFREEICNKNLTRFYGKP